MWNLVQKSEQLKFSDYGCVQATCMAISSNEQFIACGYKFLFYKFITYFNF